MNSNLFVIWLKKVNRIMVKKLRNILMFIANAPSHPATSKNRPMYGSGNYTDNEIEIQKETAPVLIQRNGQKQGNVWN